jgi:hypothetical protein
MEIGKQIAIGAGHRFEKFELACGRGSLPQFNKQYCESLRQALLIMGVEILRRIKRI